MIWHLPTASNGEPRPAANLQPLPLISLLCDCKKVFSIARAATDLSLDDCYFIWAVKVAAIHVLPDNQPPMLGGSDGSGSRVSLIVTAKRRVVGQIFYHIRTPRVPDRDALRQNASSVRLGTASLCAVHPVHVGYFDSIRIIASIVHSDIPGLLIDYG